MTLVCGPNEIEIGTRTFVMGIVNLTPDSFSDGGALSSVDAAVAHAMKLLRDGADILDLGGESTRPGAEPVSVDEELRRVLPVVEKLVEVEGITNLSIDTRSARVAAACLDMGASWINDVSALRHDPDMLEVAKRADAIVLMHAREMSAGKPGDVVEYDDVVKEVRDFLRERMQVAVAAGIPPDHIVVDPGIGFGKRIEDNVRLTRQLSALWAVGAPVLYGASRKRFIGELAGVKDPAHRDAASVGAACFAAMHGVDLVRVHDVRSTVQALRVVDELWRTSNEGTLEASRRGILT